MPMNNTKDFGANTNNSKNNEYCCFCLKAGKFTDEGISIEGKIKKNIEIAKKMGIPEKKARDLAKKTIPNLKRWRKKWTKEIEE